MPAIVNTPTNTQKIKKVLLVPVRYLIVSLLAVLFIVSFIPIIVFYLIFNAVSKLCSLAGIDLEMLVNNSIFNGDKTKKL